MSDYFSGHRCRQLPCLGPWSDRNVVSGLPFAFNNFFCYPNLFAVYNGGYQSGNSVARLPLTANMRVGTWGRGGAKAYFRFHGGIGGGCYGIACRNSMAYTVARPLQLFDALDPIYFQGGFVNIRMIGPPFLPVEASNGTGVYLPVYPKRIRARKGMHVRGGREGGCKRHGGRKKQDDTVSKAFVCDDVVKKEVLKDIEEIPIEMLLPSEWSY